MPLTSNIAPADKYIDKLSNRFKLLHMQDNDEINDDHLLPFTRGSVRY